MNPKLQECMISTLVGHSGFELWYSEKDWSNGADSMNAIEVKRFVKKKSWRIKLQFKVFKYFIVCTCVHVCV